MFKKYTTLRGYIIPLFLVALALVFNACQKDEEGSNGTTQLDSFGPSPALRGGELKFIGTGLDKITSIVLPGDVTITTFKSKTPELIVIDIPQETVEGHVMLIAPEGNITTKTPLGIAEPISISSISPVKVRPGDVVTIDGEYLNLIYEVIFANGKSVTEFESQSRSKIEVRVPDNAQTGKVALSNGEEIPIVVTSEENLEIALPTATTISPTTIKAGNHLTITGTDLDLATTVVFAGDKSVSTFVSKSATEIVVVVPVDAKDGKINLVAASDVKTEIATSLTLVVPTIGSVTPNPAKNSGFITVTGTDLDLVSGVVFGGEKTGEIQSGRTATEIKVKVPADAVDGTVKFNTQAGKSVPFTQSLTLVVPTITSITPLAVNSADQPVITITGTNLDVADTIVFGGNWKNLVSKAISVSETEIKIGVPPGSLSGKVKIITTNGTEVTSAETLTVNPDVPSVTGIPSTAYIGTIITLTGTNMNVATDVMFPGDIKATLFGTKSATTLEVFVPLNVMPGKGKIKFITSKNEVYESPQLTFGFPGVEPVQSDALVFFNFNGTGKDSWWGQATVAEEGGVGDGTKYGRINGSFNGWTDLFWRNSSNNFPGSAVSTNVNDYVVKFDVQFLSSLTAGNIKLRFQGSEGDFWFCLGPAAPTGGSVVSSTPGWTTITVPISAFKDNYGYGSNSPADISKVVTFGMAFDNGSATVNFKIDNVRFHKIN